LIPPSLGPFDAGSVACSARAFGHAPPLLLASLKRPLRDHRIKPSDRRVNRWSLNLEHVALQGA
jgi:hypothetical protein